MVNKFIRYIKTKTDLIIWISLILLLFAFIYYLENREFTTYIIGLEVVVLCFSLYLFIDFGNYKEQLNLKENYQKQLDKNQQLKEEFSRYKNESKEYFMLLVHQIKTPITAAHLLLENQEANKNLLRQELILIDDYVNMTIAFLKIIETNADMDIYPLELDKVIKSVLKKYSILFIEKKIKLNFQPTEALVISDFRWLSILIEQLISNAIKYSEQGTITIYYQNDTLFIADNGIGIKTEDIKKIFDIGYSGFNGRRNQKSSGLGLYLAKKIALKLNIQIEVQSKLGEGSTFMLKFNK